MTFPNVKYITYSTCSIYKEEDELVVYKALKDLDKKYGEFQVELSLPKWKHRGMKCDELSEDITNKMIRCGIEDNTNGFFVTLLKRVKNVDDSVVYENNNNNDIVEIKSKQQVKAIVKPTKPSTILPTKRHINSDNPNKKYKRKKTRGHYNSHKVLF